MYMLVVIVCFLVKIAFKGFVFVVFLTFLLYSVYSACYGQIIYLLLLLLLRNFKRFYAAGVWCIKDTPCSNAVQSQAMRCFLGVHKCTDKWATEVGMGW